MGLGPEGVWFPKLPQVGEGDGGEAGPTPMPPRAAVPQTPALPLAELVDMKPLPGSQPFPAVRSACPLPGLCLPCSLASCLPCSLASCLPPRHHTLFKACSSCRSEGKSLPSGNHGLVLIWGAVNFSEPQFLLHEMGITVPFLRVLVGCWEEAMRELPGTGWMQGAQ